MHHCTVTHIHRGLRTQGLCAVTYIEMGIHVHTHTLTCKHTCSQFSLHTCSPPPVWSTEDPLSCGKPQSPAGPSISFAEIIAHQQKEAESQSRCEQLDYYCALLYRRCIFLFYECVDSLSMYVHTWCLHCVDIEQSQWRILRCVHIVALHVSTTLPPALNFTITYLTAELCNSSSAFESAPLPILDFSRTQFCLAA